MKNPPVAEQKPELIETHGDRRIDEFAWLRDSKNETVRGYIEAENAYADDIMKSTRKVQRDLYKEIRARMKEDDMSVPVKDGSYLYYVKTKKGKQYAIHYRKHIATGREEVILDENELARDQKYFSLGVAEVNQDHTLLAYSIDTTGSEQYTLFIKDLRTGKLLSERIESVADVEWAENNEHLLYTREEHPHPPRRVFLHTLRSDAPDTLLFEESDPQWYVGIDKSRSKRFIYIVSANFSATEVRMIPAHAPNEAPRLIAPRAKEVKYFVEDHGEYLYILTNERAVNFKIMRTPLSAPGKSSWRTWIGHDSARAITGLLVYETFFALSVRENGAEHVYIHAAGDPKGIRLKFPEDEHSLHVWGDIEFSSECIRVTYHSFLTPRTVYDYDVKKKKFAIRKKQTVPGWNASGYISKRLWVKNGGVSIPVSIAYAKKVKLNGSAPLLLEAYGAYGISNDPAFSISKLSLLKRGWIIATAHVRGGGEMGWQWHKQAKLLTKHRTYEDVIACADYLVAKKVTSRKHIALIGGSAGGMMVGAVLNMRPDLVRAAIALVPAADVLTSSFDESLGGTRLHYDETGDPRDPKVYRYLKKYSPYEAVRHVAYPSLLVRANMNDIRTPYWEAAKWIARLRTRKTDANLLLMKTETVAGHFGKSGRYEWIKDRAFDYAFLMKALADEKNR